MSSNIAVSSSSCLYSPVLDLPYIVCACAWAFSVKLRVNFKRAFVVINRGSSDFALNFWDKQVLGFVGSLIPRDFPGWITVSVVANVSVSLHDLGHDLESTPGAWSRIYIRQKGNGSWNLTMQRVLRSLSIFFERETKGCGRGWWLRWKFYENLYIKWQKSLFKNMYPTKRVLDLTWQEMNCRK